MKLKLTHSIEKAAVKSEFSCATGYRINRKRSALERINATFGRDFQLEHHYMRGLETMQMRVALSLSVMLAMACTSIREGQPQRMRSLILPLAA